MHTSEQMRLSLLQAKLDDLSNFLTSSSINADGTEDSAYWQKMVAAFHNGGVMPDEIPAEETVMQAFDAFIKTKATKKMRQKQLAVVKRMAMRYTLYIKEDLKLTDWDENHLCSFEQFLRIEHTFFNKNGECLKQWTYLYEAFPETRRPQVRGGNAIFSIMKRFRTFFNWCVATGRLSVSPFKKHSLTECTYGTPFYMTNDEVQRLYEFDFSNQPDLAIQRDIFVLQSKLGMRVGDFYSLTTANIVNDAIEYIPSKTLNESGKVARIPLTPIAKEIIERYHEEGAMSIVPLISEQHYNKKIKLMLKLAGIDRIVTTLNPTTRKEEKHPIWEVASSHMARRNFIGNLYAKVKDPDLIASMTGHVEGSKAFSRYRTIDDTIKKEVLSVLG